MKSLLFYKTPWLSFLAFHICRIAKKVNLLRFSQLKYSRIYPSSHLSGIQVNVYVGQTRGWHELGGLKAALVEPVGNLSAGICRVPEELLVYRKSLTG